MVVCRLEIVLERQRRQEEKIIKKSASFCDLPPLNPRFHIFEDAVESIYETSTPKWLERASGVWEQSFECATEFVRTAPVPARSPSPADFGESDPLSGEADGVVQVTGQLFPGPSFERMSERDKFWVVVE